MIEVVMQVSLSIRALVQRTLPDRELRVRANSQMPGVPMILQEGHGRERVRREASREWVHTTTTCLPYLDLLALLD